MPIQKIKRFYARVFNRLENDDCVLLCFTMIAIVFVGMFVPIRYFNNQIDLATTNAIIVSVMIAIHVFILTGFLSLARKVFVTFVSGIMLVVVFLTGHQQLNWIYPTCAMLFFALRPKTALITNSCIIALIGVLLLNRVTAARWLQDIISLYCSITITYVFSYLMHKHSAALQLKSKQHERAANVDQLTGLPNRRSFESKVDRVLESWKIERSEAWLIIIDVDHFKSVNDTYGHSVGDDVLTGVAAVLRKNLRPDESVYRLGGEEFAVLIYGVSETIARACAERMRTAVQNHCFKCIELEDGAPRQITVSLGMAGYNGDTFTRWYERADRALYEAKRTGRNRLCAAA